MVEVRVQTYAHTQNSRNEQNERVKRELGKIFSFFSLRFSFSFSDHSAGYCFFFFFFYTSFSFYSSFGRVFLFICTELLYRSSFSFFSSLRPVLQLDFILLFGFSVHIALDRKREKKKKNETVSFMHFQYLPCAFFFLVFGAIIADCMIFALQLL